MWRIATFSPNKNWNCTEFSKTRFFFCNYNKTPDLMHQTSKTSECLPSRRTFRSDVEEADRRQQQDGGRAHRQSADRVRRRPGRCVEGLRRLFSLEVASSAWNQNLSLTSGQHLNDFYNANCPVLTLSTPWGLVCFILFIDTVQCWYI